MRPKGTQLEFTQERTVDLMRAYRKYLSSCRYINMSDVYENIVNMPASRFWVSEKRAFLVVSAILANKEDELSGMNPLKKEMFIEIANRIRQLQKTQSSAHLSELCSEVILQPAPKFYMSRASAKSIIQQYKKWKKEKQKRP